MVRIHVSPEMVCFLGAGESPVDDLPVDPILFAIRLGNVPTLSVAERPLDGDADFLIHVASAACQRVFGYIPDTRALYHLPVEMRAIVIAIRDCALPGEVCSTLRGAKAIELLCAIFTELAADRLVPADGDGALSEMDTRRIVLARRMIDDQWRDKLTLEGIARACGLNRAKLTRGFRVMFGTSVADAIAERRLCGARSLLLATNLPVSSIGYSCGYLNNASFTRAFARRFGVVPTRLRAMEAAA